MDEERLIRKFVRMFGCDTARIAKPTGKLFLILGWNRNTAKDREKDPSAGQWYKNKEPIDFDYVAEKVVASGNTEKELIASAKEYKRLQGMTVEEYLRERFSNLPFPSNIQGETFRQKLPKLG
jgi:hypothetical protein